LTRRASCGPYTRPPPETGGITTATHPPARRLVAKGTCNLGFCPEGAIGSTTGIARTHCEPRAAEAAPGLGVA